MKEASEPENPSSAAALATPDATFADAAVDDHALEGLASRLTALGGRVLLLGAPGTGKSTLAQRLAASLAGRGCTPCCVGADPGSPAFGAPGAVCLGRWNQGSWELQALEALCTLDAGRFRLPLVDAVRRLASRVAAPAPLLLDGPGVVRGVAGAELLVSLIKAADVHAVLMLPRGVQPPLLSAALRGLGLPVLTVTPSPAAQRRGRPARTRARTRLWDAYLESAGLHDLDSKALIVQGTPPPLEATAQWAGRQCAILASQGQTRALGEIHQVQDGQTVLRAHRAPSPGDVLLVRDARRQGDGMLGTAGADAADAVRYAPPADVLPGVISSTGPRPVVHAGPATAALVNGVLGDPLLHVRLQHLRRSLLFDLGEAGRLPARVIHQVSDVFLSHAHMDHIAGFFWLLRSRLGDLPPLRIFGPAGITDNIRGLIAGVLWDRIGNRGPRIQVAELDGERLERILLQPGAPGRELPPQGAAQGILLDEPQLRVRAAFLDHGHGTRVLAFALDTPHTFNVRKERLGASGLDPGPWLTRLKQLVAAGEHQETVELPDGRLETAGVLARDLLLRAPGIRLAYATDLADTAQNRARLTHLADGAHTLFCEASFRNHDALQAQRTGHLTTRACGEIAARCGAQRLIPFHFSRRYEDDLASCYDEVRAAFSRTITPPLRDT